MSFNKQKMIELILDERESIEERCDGYKEQVLDAIVHILNAEREHTVQRTRIQQKVNEACHSAGDFLARKRGPDNATTEETQ